METKTDVVIIGGGIIGCAIAYFLRKRAIDVILLERGELVVKHQAPQQVCSHLSALSRDQVHLLILCWQGIHVFHHSYQN